MIIATEQMSSDMVTLLNNMRTQVRTSYAMMDAMMVLESNCLALFTEQHAIFCNLNNNMSTTNTMSNV